MDPLYTQQVGLLQCCGFSASYHKISPNQISIGAVLLNSPKLLLTAQWHKQKWKLFAESEQASE